MSMLNLQLSRGHSLVFWVALNMALLHLGNSIIVHLNNTSIRLNGTQLPDEFNITLQGESGQPTYLHLKRAKHIVPNVPVYTISMDKDGKYHHHREQMENTQVIGYYQDTNSEAAIELIITGDHETNGSNFVLKGELSIGGERFTLNPDSRLKRDTSSPASSDDVPYILVPQPASRLVLHDYIDAPPEDEAKIETVQPGIPRLLPVANTTSFLNRFRRQATQNVFIDVVAVVDYAVYSRFLANSKTKVATLQALREYYAFIFNGVDLRYQGIGSAIYKIRVRLVKVVIAEILFRLKKEHNRLNSHIYTEFKTARASTFTEKFRVKSSPNDQVDANDALFEFSEFVAGSGRDMTFPYDHVMLFTGCDLTSKSASGSVSQFTTGLAFTSTLCRPDGKSVSIVEELGGFQCVDTATHELGHSLSAPHDGEGNLCRSSDRYIMSSGGLPPTESNKLNPWLFSSCSAKYFATFISSKLATSAGRTCLAQQLPVGTGVADIRDRLPGQEFSADDQCRMIYGSGSRLCRGDEFGVASEICVSMFCFDPSTTGTCYKLKATMGTTCGNGKLCLNGKCVADSRAPVTDDTCVFGDQPGTAFDGNTCPDFVNGFSGYCYQSVVRNRCCASCQKVYRAVSGCEYGDTVRGCTSNICRYASSNTLKQCCRTCNYGTPLASTSNRASIISNQTNPETPTAVSQQKATPASVIPTVSSSSCADNPNVKIGSGNCTSILVLPFLCSIKNVRDFCCSSCRTVWKQ